MAYEALADDEEKNQHSGEEKPSGSIFPELQEEETLGDTGILDSDAETQPPRSHGSGNWKPLILGVGLGIGIAVGAMYWMNSSRSPAPAEARGATPANAETSTATAQSVTVVPVEVATVQRTLDATGTVVAYDLLPVLPQASGLQIQQVLVDEGEFVAAGDVMAVLDDSVLRSQIDQATAQVESARSNREQKEAAIAQARASYAQAQASLAEAKATLLQDRASVTEAEASVVEAQASLAEAQANAAQAQRERDRYQQLADRGAISQQDLETRITAAQTAQEKVRVAEARVSRAQAGIRSAQANIERAQAKVKSSEANLQSAAANVTSAEAIASSAQADIRSSEARVEQQQTQLNQTLVKAPESGIVAERIARIGDVTNGGQKLFSIIRDAQLELHVKLPETQLPQIRIGSAVQITSDADARIRVQGTIREIAPLIDPQNRQATIKINLPTDDGLRSGMFLRAKITTNVAQGLTIPGKAVLPQSDGNAIVYVLDGVDKVRAVSVEVGEILDSKAADLSTATVEIKSGLQIGDRVVVEGAGYLKDGDRVRVVEGNALIPETQL